MIARDQTFSDLTIFLDGGTYTGCTFERCKFVVSGILPIYLVGNKVIRCRWEFAGPAANTIRFMTSLYAGGAHHLIEQIFDTIRKNSTGQRRSGDSIVLN